MTHTFGTMTWAIVWCALSATAAQAQGPKVPPTVSIPVGRLGKITLPTGGQIVKWTIVGADVDAFREFDPDGASVTIRVIGYRAGTAWLVCYTAKGDTPSEPGICVITIGDAPDPNPPPSPADPLDTAIQAAYTAETDPAKWVRMNWIANVLKASGPIVDASPTYADLLVKLQAAFYADGVGIPKGSMPKVAGAVAAYLQQQLGSDFSALVRKPKANAALQALAVSCGKVHQ